MPNRISGLRQGSWCDVTFAVANRRRVKFVTADGF
jgi:hypothetical protein